MANLKTVSKKSKAQSMGMHTEVLTGRTQQKFLILMKQKTFITLVRTMLISIKEPSLMLKT